MYKTILPSEFNSSVFQLISKSWMLITAGDERVNTMTASWGGMGFIWNKNVATIYVRPQRYTKEFIDQHNHFSLTFYQDSYHQMLQYMGTTSGRDEDKIAHTNLSVAFEGNTPYFEEATIVIICRKLYAQEMSGEYFCEPELAKANYPQSDYHTMYIGEIEKIMIKE